MGEAQAYRFASLTNLAPMKYSQVVFTYIFDILWFGYWFSGTDICAVILISVGIAVSLL